MLINFFSLLFPLYVMYKILHTQMALVPRNAQGHGWLRPAVGVAELSQCIIQVLIFISFCFSHQLEVLGSFIPLSVAY